MNIYITRNKEKFGPYSQKDIQMLVDQNIVSEMDFAWAEGEPEWVPLKKIQGLDFTREKKHVNLDQALKQARHRMEETHHAGVTPMASLGRDMRNIKENLAFTAGDLSKFLKEMQGKSPKEMLGLVAQSSLVKGMVSSSLLFVTLIFVFTAIPFAIHIINPPEAKEHAEAEENPDEDESEDTTQTGATATAKNGTSGTSKPAVDAEGNPLPAGSTGNDIIDTLGIGETKVSAPNVNPLDSSNDDLLNDLK
jgi:hypothetical protein